MKHVPASDPTSLRFPRLLLAAGLLALLPALTAMRAEEAVPAAPIKLIFDTDMGNDVDDALALALIHALQNRGHCELLGVTLSTPQKLAGPYVDAVDTFYGRPDIPVGINPYAPDGFFPDKNFLKLAQQRSVYPHDFDPAKAPEAKTLLRQLLAAADDGSIVIVQVGFFTNTADLLESKPDRISPLSGRDLIARKVRLLSIMGGDFKNARAEYNVRFDIRAARRVADRWPTPIVWSGAEVGDAVTYPAASIEHDFNYVRPHLIRESYQNYMPTPHERPCWDLTSVWAAVHSGSAFFSLSPAGRVHLTRTGVVEFTPGENGRDRYVTVTAEQASAWRQSFAQLVSAPPKAH